MTNAKTVPDSSVKSDQLFLNNEVLVRVNGVSKKFCRSLKKSLWYGVKDIVHELNPRWRRRLAGHQDVYSANLRNDEFWAVNDVSFELRRGECLGLIGHNGAGKTTLLKLLNGLIKPDKGSIEMRGRVGALIALGAGFNPILSGRENVYVNAAILGLSKQEIDEKLDEIVDFAEIGEFIDAPVQSYSSGMQVKLGFAVATALTPDVLLLDEVLAVGDMRFQAKCFNRVSQLRCTGAAFILVSHNMHNIARFSDKVLLLNRGSLTYLGNPGEGIAAFNAVQELNAIDSGERSQVGSLKVKQLAAFFTDEYGRSIDETHALAPVNLNVEFDASDSTHETITIDVTLRIPSGDALMQESMNIPLLDSHGVLKNKFGVIVMALESLPSNGPELAVGIAIWGGDYQELYCWNRNLVLKVVGKPSSIGIAAARVSWDSWHADSRSSLETEMQAKVFRRVERAF